MQETAKRSGGGRVEFVMRTVRRVTSCGSLVVLLFSLSTDPAVAQDASPSSASVVIQPLAIADDVVQPFRAATEVLQGFKPGDARLPAFGAIVQLPVAGVSPQIQLRRPSSLIPMYGSLAVLQGLDMHSTMKGISSSQGREANPIMQPVVENGAALLAVKASVTVGVIWASEKMWKKHRKAAVVSVFVVNALMAGVVANNYRNSDSR